MLDIYSEFGKCPTEKSRQQLFWNNLKKMFSQQHWWDSERWWALARSLNTPIVIRFGWWAAKKVVLLFWSNIWCSGTSTLAIIYCLFPKIRHRWKIFCFCKTSNFMGKQSIGTGGGMKYWPDNYFCLGHMRWWYSFHSKSSLEQCFFSNSLALAIVWLSSNNLALLKWKLVHDLPCSCHVELTYFEGLVLHWWYLTNFGISLDFPAYFRASNNKKDNLLMWQTLPQTITDSRLKVLEVNLKSNLLTDWWHQMALNTCGSTRNTPSWINSNKI